MSVAIELGLAVFGFVLTILGTILISCFNSMRKDLKQISDSVVEMNIKLEKVITDQSWHKDEMNEMKERIVKLETKEIHNG